MSSASASMAAWQRHAVVHPGSSGAQRVKTKSLSSTRADWHGEIALCCACATGLLSIFNICPKMRINSDSLGRLGIAF